MQNLVLHGNWDIFGGPFVVLQINISEKANAMIRSTLATAATATFRRSFAGLEEEARLLSAAHRDLYHAVGRLDRRLRTDASNLGNRDGRLAVGRY